MKLWTWKLADNVSFKVKSVQSSDIFVVSQSDQTQKETHLAFCQSCQYFNSLQLRQSITKHFTNHSMTTISCPTPGLEIQHASQRPREVCKQPGIKQE